jgi:hypothetical protein
MHVDGLYKWDRNTMKKCFLSTYTPSILHGTLVGCNTDNTRGGGGVGIWCLSNISGH